MDQGALPRGFGPPGLAASLVYAVEVRNNLLGTEPKLAQGAGEHCARAATTAHAVNQDSVARLESTHCHFDRTLYEFLFFGRVPRRTAAYEVLESA